MADYTLYAIPASDLDNPESDLRRENLAVFFSNCMWSKYFDLAGLQATAPEQFWNISNNVAAALLDCPVLIGEDTNYPTYDYTVTLDAIGEDFPLIDFELTFQVLRTLPIPQQTRWLQFLTDNVGNRIVQVFN